MVAESFPNRKPWVAFPDVVIVAPQSDVKNHADYAQAKHGNVQDAAPAAKRLAASLLTDKAVAAVQDCAAVGTRLVPVHALEGQGYNRIPAAFAELLGERLGLLVDDFVGQGGTLANLRGHILHHGGEVSGAICLTGRSDSAKLALNSETLEALRKKYGSELEQWWLQSFGYDFSALTESEGRYLLRVENADTVRAQIAAARPEGHS